MLISIILTILTMLFVVTGYMIEKKEIKKLIKGEKIVSIISEKTSDEKILTYIVICFLFIFIIQPTNITPMLLIVKILFLMSFYFIDQLVKNKMYLTEENIYITTKFENKKIFEIIELQEEVLEQIETIENKKGEYNIYLELEKKKFNIRIKINNDEEIIHFKHLVYQNTSLDLTDEFTYEVKEKEEPKSNFEKELLKLETQGNGIDYLTYSFVLLTVISIVGGLYYSTQIGGEMEPWKKAISMMFAVQTIPVAIYLFSFFFMISIGRVKKSNKVKLTTKEIIFISILGINTLPVGYTLMTDGIQHLQLLLVQMISLGVFVGIIATGWTFGKIAKLWIPKNY